MSRARRIALAVVVVVVVALAAGTMVAFSVVRRSLPDTDGEVTLAGLSGKVTVLRDARGVPQIYADDAEDLFRAQGFVHAQDRFFEMDLRRHVTSGRLSELVGADGLETDKVIRTLGWRRVAEAELPTLAPTTRRYLQAYADGVNAYIEQADSPSEMSLEYTVLGQKVKDYRVEDWTPADSLAWLKAMAWDLRSNYDSELTRARLFGTVSQNQIADIYPPYPYALHDSILSTDDWRPPGRAGSAIPSLPGTPAATGSNAEPATVPSAEGLPEELFGKDSTAAYTAVQHALAAVPQLIGRGDGVGSNSWVVGSARSSTGKPLLANDPHLAVGIPGIWFQVGLHCNQVTEACPFDVSGFSFAGQPGVVIGHNQSVAWGFTNLAPDVSDFYLEQVRNDTYLRDGSYIPLESRRETIKVAGAEDQTITVRTTVHGPILSEVIDTVRDAGGTAPVNGQGEPGRYSVSLAWTGLLANKTADSIFALNTATNWDEFRFAAKDFAVPSQNLVYADTEGHIGYQAPGQIPIRRSATAGAPAGYWPAPGWVSAWDWKGFVPFENMPYVLDPAEGLIVTANQAVTASGTPFLTTEWDHGYRSQRIKDLLEDADPVTPALMSRIQGDTRNGFAPDLVKALLTVDLGDDPFTEEAQDLLRGWDYTNPADDSASAPAAAYYNAVWRNLLSRLFDDELPSDLRASGGSQWMEAVRLLLEKPRSGWWDDKSTPGVTEGQEEILRLALVQARLDLTKALGKEPSTWEWGKLHRLTLTHEVLGGDGVPGLVRSMFNRGPFPMPGGSSIVNANGWNAAQGYDVTTGPSMRMVVDLSDLDASTWVNQTGNSGHAYSDHYDDQISAWIANEPFPWPSSPDAVRKASEDEQTLLPAP